MTAVVDQLRGKRVHLVGVSGLEMADVAVWLHSHGHQGLVGHDLCAPDAFAEHFRAAHIGMAKVDREAHWDALQGADLDLRLGQDYLQDIDLAEVIVVTQSWRLYPANEPLRILADSGLAFVTPIEIYLTAAEHRGLRTIGVTGSNGKSTTTNMVASILEAAGRPHVLAGNYRYRGPVLGTLDGLGEDGVLVLEVSNHHLLGLALPVDVAVVTNVTENHLHEHAGFDDYLRVKRRLIENQSDGAIAIVNADDPVSSQFEHHARGPCLRFTGHQTGAHAAYDKQSLRFTPPESEPFEMPRGDLAVPGEHNAQNALAAGLAAISVAVDADAVLAGLRAFDGIKGRLEHVREVGGVDFYYDVESTTPESSVRAIEAFEGRPVRLIAGGDNKGLSYSNLAKAAKAVECALHVLPGTASDDLLSHSNELDLEVRPADSLAQAVEEAFSYAREGCVVVLSPGARGFYNAYVKGQPSFARLVKKLKAAQRGKALDPNA